MTLNASQASHPERCPQCTVALNAWGEGVPLQAFCHQCRFPLKYVADTYQLKSVLGTGGFGTVYLAQHLAHHHYVAIKLLHQELVNRSSLSSSSIRFQRESKVTATLAKESLHIVQIYDAGHDEHLGPYYVMEYLEGQTLQDLLEERGSFALPELLSLFAQICDGLAVAHHRQVIHRDLKPGNLYLISHPTMNFFVKIIDFGIAKVLEDTLHPELTQGMLGTPLYMSPEQCHNQSISPQSDVYALGAIFYHLLTGTPLFSVQSRAELLVAHLSYTPEPMASRRPDLKLDPALDSVVLRALSKDPSARFPDAGALWKALQPWHKAQPTFSAGPSPSSLPPTLEVSPPIVPTEEYVEELPKPTTPQRHSPWLKEMEQLSGDSRHSSFFLKRGGLFLLLCMVAGAGLWLARSSLFPLSPPQQNSSNFSIPSPEKPLFPGRGKVRSRQDTNVPERRRVVTTSNWHVMQGKKAGQRSQLPSLPQASVIWVPAGKVQVGPSQPVGPAQQNYALQRQNIHLSQGFWMMQSEVTQKQFRTLMGHNPSYFTKCGDSCPVERVSWHDALFFAHRLSHHLGLPSCFRCTQHTNDGQQRQTKCSLIPSYQGVSYYQCPGFRLPTEGEWEYAVRGGLSNKDYTPSFQTAWYQENADYHGPRIARLCSPVVQERCLGPHPTRQKKPNRWGLYDMLGNVSEWCFDLYQESHRMAPRNPTGPTIGSERVIRGGAWGHPKKEAQAFWRDSLNPTWRNARVGFRLVLSPQ